MARFRTIIFWAHLTLGVCTGVVIFTLSATGLLLTYEKQIRYWADTRGIAGAPPHADARALSPAELLAAVARQRDDAATAIRMRAAADAPVEFVFGSDGSLFLNRYTGAVLGEGSPRTHAFFTKVTEIHRYLAASGDARERGKAITGAANMEFLFIIIAGFYLWWPRNMTRRAFAAITRFRTGLSPKARDFNWHNVIGIWSAVPLFVIVLSATVISYPWANDLMYRMAGDTPPPRPGAAPAEPREPRAPRPERPATPPPATYDAIVTAVQREVPGWKTMTLTLRPGREGLNVAVERGWGGQPQKKVQVVADAQTLKLTKVTRWADNSPGRQARLTLRYFHTGEWLGIPGQTIAGIVSFGALLLVWTGISLALRRLWSWRRRGGNATRPTQDAEAAA